MPSIITYDVNGKQTEVKAEMLKKGFKDRIPGITNCEIIYFPETCLHHLTKTPKEAHDTLTAICLELKIKLERCVSVTWDDNWYASCGESYTQTLKK
ncbi:MAG: hypothetical protein KA163_07235 [Bacteroidia bacterium]|nr:hypothetical protein [Bacteroidia bacterium]